MQGQKSLKQKGTQQFKNKNYHKALDYYKDYIVQEHDDNIQTMLNIALCYYKLQEYESGINMCNQILEIDEKYSKCYYRRAMCRKEILDKDKDNMVERYRLYYDCLMFKKHSDPKGLERELDEFATLGKTCKELITPCQPTKISAFQRSLLELEKENISLYALSQLQERLGHHSLSEKDPRQQIDRLYKEMNAVRKQIKDPEQLKLMVELISDKIKRARKEMLAAKQAQSSSKQQEQKSVTTDTKESKEQLNSKLDVVGEIKTCAYSTEVEIAHQSQEVKQCQILQNELNNSAQIIKINLEQQGQIKKEDQQTNTPQINVLKNQPKEQVRQQEVKVQVKNTKQPMKKQKSVIQKTYREKNVLGEQKVSAQSLLQTIKQQMSKSRDTFNEFSKVLNQILNSQQIVMTTKQQLLKVIPNNIVNFRIIISGLCAQKKQKLKQTFDKLKISSQIRKLYIK